MHDIQDLLSVLANQTSSSSSENTTKIVPEVKDEEIYYNDDYTDNYTDTYSEEDNEEDIADDSIEDDAVHVINNPDKPDSTPVVFDKQYALRECPGCKSSKEHITLHPFINKHYIAHCCLCGYAVISYDEESTVSTWNTRYTDNLIHNLEEQNKELSEQTAHAKKELENAVALLEDNQSSYESIFVEYKDAVKKYEDAEQAYEVLKVKTGKLLSLEDEYKARKRECELDLRTIEDTEKNTRYNLKEREFTTGTIDKATRKELQNIMYKKMGKEAEIKLLDKLLGEL